MAYDPRQESRSLDEPSGALVSGFLSRRFPGERVERALFSTLARHRALWTLAVGAMVLDIALTGVGLSMGLVERNPVALSFIESYGLVTAGVILKGGAIALGLLCWRVLPDSHRGIVPLGLAIPSWGAVCINTVMIASVL